MYIFSRSTFGVARVLMALAVFFCHVFELFNDFGFLFVGVFFFMSGFGMEKSGQRMSALVRVFPYVVFFVFFQVIYWVVFRCNFPYPSGWFLVVYFLVMLMYRFFAFRWLLWAFLGLALLFCLLGFNWVWSASYGAFLFGVFFARNEKAFTFRNCLLFLPGVVMLSFNVPAALWCVLPLFSLFVLRLSASFRPFRSIAWLGQYTFFFYCVHCFFLGVFGSTWTLGGVPSFYGVVGAFLCSCVCAWYFKDYLFKTWR